MKIAYLDAPDLPIQVERRRRPELRGHPLVVLGAPSGGRRLVEAASAEARMLGVARGQTARQAEHCCPEAELLTDDPAAYDAAYRALLAALGRCTPTVQPYPATFGAELDVGGLELLFGPDDALAAELIRRAARAGLRARAGLGPNRLVARLAAGQARLGEAVVVAPFEARAFLERQPLARLPLGAESHERLALLGVRTLGQLLRLPRAGLAQQVGPDAAAIVQAAGADGERLVPYRPSEWLMAAADLDGPLETREQLERRLRPLVRKLVDQLEERHLGAGAVRLRFGWWQGEGACPAALPAVTADGGVILDAALGLAVDLARQQDGELAPEWVVLGLGDLGPLGARQPGLFDGQRQRRLQAARAVDELAERFGGQLRAPAFRAGR